MGLLPHTFCLPESPARWSSLVGLVWLRVEVGAFFRETKGWGREDVPLHLERPEIEAHVPARWEVLALKGPAWAVPSALNFLKSV